MHARFKRTFQQRKSCKRQTSAERNLHRFLREAGYSFLPPLQYLPHPSSQPQPPKANKMGPYDLYIRL